MHMHLYLRVFSSASPIPDPRCDPESGWQASVRDRMLEVETARGIFFAIMGEESRLLLRTRERRSLR
jgi:hypothetical protein